MRIGSSLALAAALVLAAPRTPHAAPARGGRSAVEDDWARALGAAKARGVPILVDVWAPW
ncbi:MAG TPA: hypothetical protein VF912_00565 [Anaeromyxobacter sp.]